MVPCCGPEMKTWPINGRFWAMNGQKLAERLCFGNALPGIQHQGNSEKPLL